jgi:3'-phosphoadenosine 5'-phosphosulfate (PAPS) 3'-phosphatase
MICEGHAHLYLDMSGRTSLWDTCAPAALLQEAGGRMTDLKGMQLLYDSSEPLRTSQRLPSPVRPKPSSTFEVRKRFCERSTSVMHRYSRTVRSVTARGSDIRNSR